MNDKLNKREILSKIKNQLNELNDSQIELESEMSKCLYIDNTIQKIDELSIIKKVNNNLINEISINGY